MNARRLLLSAVVLLAAFLARASAQSAPPGNPALVRAKLYFLSVDSAPVRDLAFLNGKELVPVTAPTEFVSQPLDYVGPALLRLAPGAVLLAPPAPGGASAPQPSPAETTTVALSAEGGEWLILLGRRQGALHAMAVDFSAASMPEDSYLFWNLTGRPLGVVLGDARQLVAAGQRQVMRVPAGADYLPLRVFENNDGEARQAFASRHLHQPGRRQLVFLSETGEAGRVRLRMITQQVAKLRPEVAGR